jgi:hypothetical protein
VSLATVGYSSSSYSFADWEPPSEYEDSPVEISLEATHVCDDVADTGAHLQLITMAYASLEQPNIALPNIRDIPSAYISSCAPWMYEHYVTCKTHRQGASGIKG